MRHSFAGRGTESPNLAARRKGNASNSSLHVNTSRPNRSEKISPHDARLNTSDPNLLNAGDVLRTKTHPCQLNLSELRLIQFYAFERCSRLLGERLWRQCWLSMSENSIKKPANRGFFTRIFTWIVSHQTGISPAAALPWIDPLYKHKRESITTFGVWEDFAVRDLEQSVLAKYTSCASFPSERDMGESASRNTSNPHLPLPEATASEAKSRPSRQMSSTNAPGTTVKVPNFLICCVRFLMEDSRLLTEGIFRTPGSAKRVKNAFEELQGRYFSQQETIDDRAFLGLVSRFSLSVHDVAGLITLYLRAVWQHPLLTFEMYETWIVATHTLIQSASPGNGSTVSLNQAGKVASAEKTAGLANESLPETLKEAWRLLFMLLPDDNRAVLEFLMRFLHAVSMFSRENRMDSRNLSLVFCPNVLSPRNWEKFLHVQDLTTAIVKRMIDEPDLFFCLPSPSEESFSYNHGERVNPNAAGRPSTRVSETKGKTANKSANALVGKKSADRLVDSHARSLGAFSIFK